jgi:hypothetical protein
MILGLNELFKKKEKKKEVDNSIDFVITELEVRLRSYDNPFGCFASFIFVDEKPAFPRVRRTLHELNKHPDAFVLGHTYSYKDITSKTDLSGLEITKH